MAAEANRRQQIKNLDAAIARLREQHDREVAHLEQRREAILNAPVDDYPVGTYLILEQPRVVPGGKVHIPDATHYPKTRTFRKVETARAQTGWLTEAHTNITWDEILDIVAGRRGDTPYEIWRVCRMEQD